ncbi:hypothetical protein HanRHA438_Chr04g0183731 [Helianthus annuus]|nr:hypothetical protein HanIR_Chr04g0187671 [Helianthus annuus]KAJ0927512.1 hypothetical protein HanRHA438_Chr04g0183731 [Helianthus annuus]
MPIVNGDRSFETKPRILNMLSTFHGKGSEEPYAHITDFEVMCGMIVRQEFTPNQVKVGIVLVLIERCGERLVHIIALCESSYMVAVAATFLRRIIHSLMNKCS